MTTTDPTDSATLTTLRGFARTVNDGGTVDPQAVIAAIGGCVADGIDVDPEIAAFEPAAAINVCHLGGADGVALIRAALSKGGWRAAFRMASLLSWHDVWAAGMTAHYGPTGIHPSRCGADGCPTAETLATCPGVAERMLAAADRFERLLGWYERVLPPTRWRHVVDVRATAKAA